MNWYAAHLILFFRLKQGKQRSVRVWENVVLVRAETEAEAFAKAERRGREEQAADDGTIRLGSHPAELVFAGVRKVVLCEDETKRPSDGSEVTYTEMVLPSEKAVYQLAAGDSVAVTIDETFADNVKANATGPHRMAE
jgi:hypothetical protein